MGSHAHLLEKRFYLPVPSGLGRAQTQEYVSTASRVILQKYPLASVFSPGMLPQGLLYAEYLAVCRARAQGWATSVVYRRAYDSYNADDLELLAEAGLDEHELDLEAGTLLPRVPKTEGR